jgi:uncharacterized damage-inducible protein DinB
MSPPPTHPRAREVFDYLVTARVHLDDAVRAVPAAARDRRRTPDRWSAAEILEHLARVNESIARLVHKRVSAGREAGLGPDPETTSILWTLDVARLLDRRERMEAPDRIQPTGGLTADAAWDALQRADETLQQTVRDADGLALATITYPHHFLGPLNLYQWVAFAAAHEFRHSAQIRELAAEVPGPTRV